MMSGADELDALSHELSEFARRDAAAAQIDEQLAESLEAAESLFEPESRREG